MAILTRASVPALPDDRLEWTPEDLAELIGRTPQAITYHCRQLQRRGRLHKTGGVWRFSPDVARLLLKHVLANSHEKKDERVKFRSGSEVK